MRTQILRAILPALRAIGRIHAPYAKKKIKAKFFLSAERVLMPGDFLLVKTYGELTNLVIPGELKHGAIYAGENRIVEALGAGVVLTDLMDFSFSKDEIVIVRPLFCDSRVALNAAQWALLQQGTPYDYEFRSNNKFFYCFELGFAAYREAMNGKSPWELRPSFGEPTVTGDDYLRASKKWQIVLDSRKAL